jgi:glutaredoxin
LHITGPVAKGPELFLVQTEDDPAVKEYLKLVVYGAEWCPDARRSRAFLQEHGIPFECHDIDVEAAAKEFVKQTSGGEVIIPVIVFPDKSTLTEPSNAELEQKLAMFGS